MKLNLNLGDTQLIIDIAKKRGILRNQLAYLLATALWETGHTMKPVKEAYWLSEAWRKKNLRYYPWYGRGYVQLTWEDNYKKAQKILNLGDKLTTNPDNVMVPDISAEILIVGSRDGWFRAGQTLSKYITLQKSDYFNARNIINGDKNYTKDVSVDGKKVKKKVGTIIEEYAKEYEKELKKIGYGEESTVVLEPYEDPKSEPKRTETTVEKFINFIIDLLFSRRT